MHILAYDLLFQACSLKWQLCSERGKQWRSNMSFKKHFKIKWQCPEWKPLTSNCFCQIWLVRSSWPPGKIDNKQTLHKSKKYSVSINVCLVPCHRSSNLSLLITPPVISLTPFQPLPNPWYRLYSWHYGRDHLSTQRPHAVLPVQTAWLVGHPWLAVWSVSVQW